MGSLTYPGELLEYSHSATYVLRDVAMAGTSALVRDGRVQNPLAIQNSSRNAGLRETAGLARNRRVHHVPMEYALRTVRQRGGGGRPFANRTGGRSRIQISPTSLDGSAVT